MHFADLLKMRRVAVDGFACAPESAGPASPFSERSRSCNLWKCRTAGFDPAWNLLKRTVNSPESGGERNVLRLGTRPVETGDAAPSSSRAAMSNQPSALGRVQRHEQDVALAPPARAN